MDLKFSGIYEIVAPSGKRYVGSAVSIARRWRDHRRMLREGRHHCSGLQRASDKYGVSALRFELLERCDKAELIVREQHHLDVSPDRLYNSAKVAGSTLGVKKSPAEIAQMRARNLGKRLSIEHRARISQSSRGHKKSEETKARMRVAFKGHTRLTAASREKMGRTLSAQRSSTGHRGISCRSGRWIAKAPGNIYIGTYATLELALAAQSIFAIDPTASVRPDRPVSNTSGTKNVRFHKARQKWCLVIRGKHLGLFPTKDAAEEAKERYLQNPAGYKPNLSANNTSGYRGVSFVKATNRWVAKAAGKHIGLFDTREAAAAARAAYMAAAQSCTIPRES